MIIYMAVLTIITAIITPLLLVRSCYYSERNYKKGKLYWKISIATGTIYSISLWVTLIMLVCKFVDFIF